MWIMENNIYTKHYKTFSKKCVLEYDFFFFFLTYQTLENFFQLFSRLLPNIGK